MRVILNLTIILVLFSMLSCGKKSRLDELPDSNYPRGIQAQMIDLSKYNNKLIYKKINYF